MGKCSSRNNPAWLPAAALPVSSLSHAFREGAITVLSQEKGSWEEGGKGASGGGAEILWKGWFVGRQGERQITGKDGPVGVQALSQEEAREKCLKLKPRPQSPVDWQWLYRCISGEWDVKLPHLSAITRTSASRGWWYPVLSFWCQISGGFNITSLVCQIKLNPKRKIFLLS